jgi:sugar lactone lactonase YvrE
MGIRKSILPAAVALCIPAMALAQSNAYVLLSGTANGSITPLHPDKGTLGPSYFVPVGGTLMAIAPASKQIWEVVSIDGGVASVAVLDPQSGATLATIPIGLYVESMTFDRAGRFVYLSATSGSTYYLVKIDVSSLAVVQQTVSATFGYPSQVAFSSDGSRLFLPSRGSAGVTVVDPVSLKPLASIPLPFPVNSILVSGSTLLVSGGTQLLYFDTTTLEQTNSATVPVSSFLFAVSADGGVIYLYAAPFPGTNSMAILDFASGQTLVSRPFPNAALGNALLSPDGARIVAAGSPVLLLDANTLATIATIVPMGDVASAAYFDPKTVLLLNYASSVGGGAMAVIDQAAAQITAMSPVCLDTPLEESAFADPELGAVWVGGYEAAALSAVDGASGRVAKSYLVYGLSPAARAGDQIFGSNNSAAAFYNLATGANGYLPLVLDLGQDYFVQALAGAVSPDGKTYWTSFIATFTGGSSGGPMQPSAPRIPTTGIGIYDTATDTLVARIAPPNGVGPFVFGPRNATAFVAGAHTIAVYDTRTLQNTANFTYATTFTALSISPDGATLYATDGTAIYVLDSTTGEQKQFFPIQPAPPYYPGFMVLSPDGTTLYLTDSSAQAVYMIETASGQVRQVPVGAFPSAIAVLPSN